MKMSPFQIGILIFSGVMIVFAVLIFSGALPIGLSSNSDKSAIAGNFTIWGTFRPEGLRDFASGLSTDNYDLKVNYVQKNGSTFASELSEAISAGQGPDLIFITQEDILRNRSKLVPIPYETYPERSFRDTYVEEANLFLLPEGVIALPLLVDPMVMYYNRSLLEAAGIPSAPNSWSVITAMTKVLTKKDGNGILRQSTVPFGIYGNLNAAKDVLSTLIMQAGDPIVAKSGNTFRAVLGTDTGAPQPPAQSALEFFLQFANPLSPAFSWNRAQIASRDAFTAESLVFHFGYGSEVPLIASKNPNLNFDIAKMPQIEGSKSSLTFGKVYAIGVIKASKNPVEALKVAMLIAQKDSVEGVAKAISESFPIAPARRDLLGVPPETRYGPIIYGSALMARGWYDPNDSVTDDIMYKLTEETFRGAVSITEALGNARAQLELAL